MTWKRIESSTVDPDVEEGLQARIADPFWSLARQWQVGEFRGEDAATPLLVRLRADSVAIDSWQVGPPGTPSPGRPLGPGAALEPIVEAESPSDGRSAARAAAESAHLLIERLRADIDDESRQAVVAVLRALYPLVWSDDPLHRDAAGERRLALLARLAFDALAFARDVAAKPAAVLETLATEAKLSKQVRPRLATAIAAWGKGLADVFVGEVTPSTWNPARMEYEFRVGAPIRDAKRGVTLAARDHGGGRLDWYSFDIVGTHPRNEAGQVHRYESEVLPVPLQYAGMPATRFWEFEDAEVYFGGIDAEPDDIARAALAAYAAVYGDDWYLVPLAVPTGHGVQVTAVEVLDDFGDVTEVPSSAALDGAGRRFRGFELTGDGSAEQGGAPVLFIPPSVDATDAGRPLDDVSFARDEAANLAWAVERRVEGTYGRGIDPVAAAVGARVSPHPQSETSDGTWTFRLGGEIPDHWVPLLPVRIDGGVQVGLQRGRVPLPDGTSRGALSSVLEPDQRLVIEESEIPAAGLRVVRRFQSARTRSGALRVWLGRQKGPGRPAADSGYTTDQLLR